MKTLSPATRRGGHQRRRPCIGGGHRCRDHNKRARPLYADWNWSPVLAEIAFPFAYLHAITQSWQVNKNNNNDCRRWARAPKIFWWEVRWQLGLRFITNYFQTSSTRQIHQCLQMMIFLQKWSKSHLNTDLTIGRSQKGASFSTTLDIKSLYKHLSRKIFSYLVLLISSYPWSIIQQK